LISRGHLFPDQAVNMRIYLIIPTALLPTQFIDKGPG